MRMKDRPKCKCGTVVGLFMKDSQWWCRDCIWKEVERLRNAIKEHQDNFPDEPLEGERKLWTVLKEQ